MDPSAAPWRVLESSAVPVADAQPATGAAEPAARAFLISPVTAAAVVGAIALAVAAFLLASVGPGSGVVQVQGGHDAPLSVVGAGSSGPVGGQVGPSSALIVVEIAGAIRRPGVFHLPAGSRVGDLIDLAGGYGPRLDTERASRDLNLAARLADGDRVWVPSRDEAASSTSGTGGGGNGNGDGGASAAAGSPVDLNRATQAELEALPGIGPVTATKIITSREEQAFTTVDDLRTRKLVGAKTFDKLKDLVSVR